MGSRPQPIQKDQFSNVSAFLKASAYCLVKLLFLRIVIMAMINLPAIEKCVKPNLNMCKTTFPRLLSHNCAAKQIRKTKWWQQF